MSTTIHRSLFGGVLVLAGVLTFSGCSATPGPDDWLLEPIVFDAGLDEHGGGGRTDVAFGMSSLTSDGAGGFWASSAGSWVHVGADGETLARFNVDPEDELSTVGNAAAISPTELVAATQHLDDPALTIIDTTTWAAEDISYRPTTNSSVEREFGDFHYADVAVHDGQAVIVRFQPNDSGYLDAEVVRVPLDGGERTLLHTEPLSLPPHTTSGWAPADIDIAADGSIHLATSTDRIVLDSDGTELRRTPQDAMHPLVTAGPDGTTLWWGGSAADTVSDEGVVVAGGSSEARAVIDSQTGCEHAYIEDALTLTSGGEESPLSFLCGANAATWTGDAWIVAIGGEGGGVLVRVTPPERVIG
ncbi:MAG: hypothetical protein ACQEW8_14890 [Actinomycetota bacterium]